MPTYAERYKFAEVEKDGAKFLRDTLGLCNVEDAASALKGNVAKLGTKDVVVQYLLNALQLIERQHLFVINQRGQLTTHLHDLNNTKSDLIRVQERLIEQKPSYVQFKENVINEISTTVVQSVEDTVKTELQTYSDVLKKSDSTVSRTLLDQKTLKTVVKDVVLEEDRSRNVMIFGLVEENEERLCDKVSNLFLELGEKPKIEATRVGKRISNSVSEKKTVRPVKVSVSNTTIVHQILSKARQLRKSDQYSKVFISPDRSAEQRAQQKELIIELKKRAQKEPNKKHFIRGGEVRSVDKPSNG